MTPATFAMPTLGGYQLWADTWVRSGWSVQENALSGACRLLDPRDRLAHSGSAEECFAVGRRHAPSAGRDRAAILMHGTGRSRRSMNRLGHALGEAGWAVANIGYPSLLRPIGSHVAQARWVAEALIEDGAEEIAFVGHSLGGLIARAAMADGWPRGRAVLIGSPNRGAVLADRLKDFAPYRVITGSCGQTLTTEGTAAVPVPDTEILVVAGGNGRNGFNPLLKGDNDGVVAVAETRLGEAEAAFLLEHAIHTVLPVRRTVIAATLSFLDA